MNKLFYYYTVLLKLPSGAVIVYVNATVGKHSYPATAPTMASSGSYFLTFKLHGVEHHGASNLNDCGRSLKRNIKCCLLLCPRMWKDYILKVRHTEEH